MPRRPNASREKALHSLAGSAPQARPVEEQVEESPALADLSTPTSVPRVITVETSAASPMEAPTTPAHPNPTTSAPRVIHVDKGVGKGDISGQVTFIASLFGVAA